MSFHFDNTPSGTVTLKLPSSGSSTFTFPTNNGTNGYVLSTDGSGNLSWITPGGGGTVTSVSATAPAAGFTISGSPITAIGTLTFTLADDLAAVEGLTTTGIATRTGSNAWSTRTITGSSGRIVLTNGNGVSGNPTIDLDVSGVTAGTYTSVTVDTYGRVTAGTNPAGGGTVTSVDISSSDLTVGGNPITSSGTITLSLNTVGATKGGTGQTTYTLGDILYSNTTNSLAKLAGNTTTTKMFLRQTGTGSVSASPAWDTVTKSDVGLSAVNNAAQVQLNTVTTKGDLIVGTASATVARVGVGSDNQILIADSSQTAGVRWATNTASVGGSDTQVQYNNSGSLAGDANFTWTTGTATLSTGNLTLTGTSRRIVGDFSNATIANRTSFQTSTTNGNTSVGIIPNGSGTTAGLNLESDSAVTTGPVGQIIMVGGTDMRISSDRRGAGSYVPITFYTSATERARIDINGNLGLGMTPSSKLDITSATNNGVRITDGTVTTILYNTSSSNGTIGTTSNHALAFYTNNSERARFTATGDFCVGTTSAVSNFDVYNPSSNSTVYSRSGSGFAAFATQASGTNNSHLFFTNVTNGERARISADNTSNLIFYNGTGATERARIDTNGNLIHKNALADQSTVAVDAANAGSTTITNNTTTLLLGPTTTTIATYTITFPSTPIDGQIVRVTSAKTVTTLTLSPNSGQTIVGTAPTTISAGTSFSYMYNLANTSWYPLTAATSGGGGSVSISDVTTNATYYPTFASAASGTLSTANVTSTKLTYNPSTGDLTSVNFVTSSDERLKHNIAPITNGLEIVSQLHGKGFQFNNVNKQTYGFIAQDVEKVIPEIVNTDMDGMKSVNYQAVIAFLVESIKTLEARIVELENK